MRHALPLDALGKLVLRLSVAGLLLPHGVHKLLEPDSLTHIGNSLSDHGLPSVLAYGVLVGEIVAPLMALVGWRSRIAGVLMVVNLAAAVALMHMGEITRVKADGGWALELQGAWLFGALALALLGSGRLAWRPD